MESQKRQKNDVNPNGDWDVKRENKINKTKYLLWFYSERAHFDCCFPMEAQDAIKAWHKRSNICLSAALIMSFEESQK